MRLLPASIARTPTTAVEIFPAGSAALDLKNLAAAALDAAKSAGASFADIRLAEWYRMKVGGDRGNVNVELTSNFSYGIRVIVDGAWAFIRGSVPNAGHIAAAAQDAAATARGFATLGVQHIDLAPAPVAQGEWQTPIHGDPFLIPLQDQADLVDALGDAHRVEGGQSGLGFDWTKERRAYGSTAGSLVTQLLYRSRPNASSAGHRTYFPYAVKYLPNYGVPMAGGYETVQQPTVVERLKAASEKAAQLSLLPERRFDVGQYPVAVDGTVLAQLFGQSVGVAMEADRVLGDESDATGVSYMGPPAEVLGKKVINPLLNVTANRAMPHVQAVKWDDDGVEPEEYTLIKDGVVVDYHTSRQAAGRLANWYQSQGRPVRSHGCAVASDAGDMVTVQMPHLEVAPSKGSTSLEDLYRDIPHGLVVFAEPAISMDPRLLGGAVYYMQACEVVHGKIVGRVKDAALQFQTLPLLKALTALGDDKTVYDTSFTLSKGIPWTDTLYTASAPAGLFSKVNVVSAAGVRPF